MRVEARSGARAVQRRGRRWVLAWAVIAGILGAGDAVAQCNISASIVNRSGESYSPLALHVEVQGGTIGNQAFIDLFRSGVLYARRSEGSFGTLTREVGLGCGIDASGEWTWKVSGVCVNFDPSLPADDPMQSKNTFANTTGGPYVVTWVRPTMQAEILSPPDPRGNVKITWSFPAAVGQGRAVWIDGGQLGLNNPPPEGDYIFNVPAGRHTLSQRWCIQSNGNAASSGFDITVPPAPPPADPGTFRFDLPDAEQVRVLTHRYGDDTYPVIFGDRYPSPLQTQDHAIKVQGTVTDVSGRPMSGKTVYLRVTDPADPSAYVPRADRAENDNVDGPGHLNGGGTTASVVSDAQGRVSVTMNVSDHVAGDNYQLEASMSSDFLCGTTGCARSATYTAWKRVYIEVEKMFKKGAYLAESAPAGATTVRVADIRGLPSPPFGMRMIHAASVNSPVMEFASEDVTVTSVSVVGAARRGQPLIGDLRLDPHGQSPSLRHDYAGPETVNGVARPYLADAAGVVTGNRDADFFLPNGDLLSPLFSQAFVEHVWLTDQLPVTDDRIIFDGIIPFEERVDGPADPGDPTHHELESQWLTVKWGRNITRPARQARPNHELLFAASRSEDRNLRGATEVGSGYNLTWLFVGATTTARMKEVLVHELTHQWKVNPSPENSASGHCDLALNIPLGLPMVQDRTKRCTMTYGTREDSEADDGVVGFHYIKQNGVPHSEFLHIRQRREPMPQAEFTRGVLR